MSAAESLVKSVFGMAFPRTLSKGTLCVQSGYYDGACDYFNAKYNMWQMDPSGKLKDRMTWKGYRSGHMMYLRKEDLASGNEDIRQFIKQSLPKPGQAAKY